MNKEVRRGADCHAITLKMEGLFIFNSAMVIPVAALGKMVS